MFSLSLFLPPHPPFRALRCCAVLCCVRFRVLQGTDVESPESNKLVVVGGIIGALVVAMGATIALLPAPDSI